MYFSHIKRFSLKPLVPALLLSISGESMSSLLIEEVVITAQKREQSLQDVGVSVAAFNGSQISEMGWTSGEDVAAQTPGLVSTSSGAGLNISIFSIRGIAQSDFGEHQEAPVAVYQDDAYIASPGLAGSQLFDVERIEILRGPQGTLFGRNATGGLIHYISNKPSEEFEASVGVTLADYNQFKVEGVLNGEITDNVYGRISLFSNQHDGYVDNRIGTDMREEDLTAYRGQLLFTGDQHELLLNLHGSVKDAPAGGVFEYRASQVGADGFADFCTGCGTFLDHDGDGNFDDNDGDGDHLAGAYNSNSFLEKESHGVTVKYTYETDDFNITSVTDYNDYQKDYVEDSDGTLVNEWEFYSGSKGKQFSQEIRIDGEAEKLKWITGLYYLDIDIDFYQGFPSPAFDYLPGYEAEQNTKSWSVFGQVEYDLNDSLTLIAGLRWIEDEKDMDYQFACSGTDPLEFCTPFSGLLQDLQPRSYKRDDSDYSGKIQLDWRVNNEDLIYSSISRGIKGGGFNAPLDGFVADSGVPFDPEVLTSYEVGYKGSFLEERVRLNASAFYYDYSDFQAFIFEGLTSFVKNHDAKITGAEVELIFAIGDTWEVLLGVSVMDATVFDVDVNGVEYDQDIMMAPDLSGNLLVRKEWPLNNGARVTAQYDISYVDEQQFNNLNHKTTLSDGYALSNARLEYSSADDSWSIAAFGRNLTDKKHRVFTYDVSGFDNFSMLLYGPPRWLGVDFKYNF